MTCLVWSTKSGEEDRDAERWMGAEATTFEAPNSIQANDENRELPPEPYDLGINKALASHRYKIGFVRTWRCERSVLRRHRSCFDR